MEIKSLDGPSSFLEVIGESPRNRILDFLLGEISYDFTLKEIAIKSKVGYATIKRIWDSFVKVDLVKGTRKIGKAVFYTYNIDSDAGKALRKFYLEIIFRAAEKETEPKPEVSSIAQNKFRSPLVTSVTKASESKDFQGELELKPVTI